MWLWMNDDSGLGFWLLWGPQFCSEGEGASGLTVSFPDLTSCHSTVCVFGSISLIGFSSLVCIHPHPHPPFLFEFPP